MTSLDAFIIIGSFFALFVAALCVADCIGTYLFSKALVETVEEEDE